jgi:prepilin-type N-terminal cleavage/methylation domain-containing protein
MRNKQKGFSLIELLIVVAIILIIAAIAIPNLLRARMAANEASAVASLRTMNTACITYNSTYGQYPTSLTNMADVPAGTSPTSTSADLLDPVLSSSTPQKSGYNFVYAVTGSSNVAYTVNGNPVTPNQTGIRFFFTDQSAVVRYNPSVTAAVTDSPL